MILNRKIFFCLLNNLRKTKKELRREKRTNTNLRSDVEFLTYEKNKYKNNWLRTASNLGLAKRKLEDSEKIYAMINSIDDDNIEKLKETLTKLLSDDMYKIN